MIGFVTRWFVPLSALLVGTVAVVDEREGGNLRVLLGLPITRRDVLIGKFLGRSVVFSSTLLVGLALAGAEIWYFFIDFNHGAYAMFVALTLLQGLTFVGIGVGISALVRSRARATGASVGVFALVSFVWHVLPVGVFYLVDGRYPENVPPPWEPPAWFVFLGNANPANGYLAIFEEWAPGVCPESMESTMGTFEYRQHVVEGAGPFYLQPEFLLVVLILLGVVPLVIGAWRFGRSDLG
jgi:ABC-2 type transport system permease protein